MSDQTLTPEEIIKEVCDYFQNPVEVVLTTNQDKELVKCRQVSMYFMKEFTKFSTAKIGGYFPGRNIKKDHATVLHALKSVNNQIDTDKYYRADIEQIRGRLDPQPIPEPEPIPETPIEIENRELKAEMNRLKNHISKLQGDIYGMKLNRAKAINYQTARI